MPTMSVTGGTVPVQETVASPHCTTFSALILILLTGAPANSSPIPLFPALSLKLTSLPTPPPASAVTSAAMITIAINVVRNILDISTALILLR